MASKLYDYTPTELQTLLDKSNSYADLLRKVGLNPKGRNPDTLKKIIKEYNLDETMLNKNRSDLYSQCAYDTHKKNSYFLEDILDGKYPNYQSNKLLKRLIKEGYKENKCECCGIFNWCNKPITFHLHHKDGNHNNNKLENLEVLCPNCHSQTETFAGKKDHLHIGSKYDNDNN
jgi:5-methylcytosine-specific restriction endonuclease McrA